MYSDYYDLDAILAEQQAIPATFRTTIHGLGYLEGSEANDDLHEGTKIGIPLWLAESLLSENCIETDMPKAFSDPVLRNLRASAIKVDLYSFSPYYFLFSLKLMHLMETTAATRLSKALSQAFQERFRVVLDHTQTRIEEHTSEFVQSLDFIERDVLKQGKEAHEQYDRWVKRNPLRITKSASLTMIDFGSKRSSLSKSSSLFSERA